MYDTFVTSSHIKSASLIGEYFSSLLILIVVRHAGHSFDCAVEKQWPLTI